MASKIKRGRCKRRRSSVPRRPSIWNEFFFIGLHLKAFLFGGGTRTTAPRPLRLASPPMREKKENGNLGCLKMTRRKTGPKGEESRHFTQRPFSGCLAVFCYFFILFCYSFYLSLILCLFYFISFLAVLLFIYLIYVIYLFIFLVCL